MSGGGERPSVLDPDETWHLPEQVYLAGRPDGESGGPLLELRSLGENSQHAVLAYSSLDAFIEGCGADQPWILITRERLAELAASSDTVFSVLLDVAFPAELRGTSGGLAGEEPRWDVPESEVWTSVYVPSRPYRRGQENAELELQPMPGQRLALMAYSSQRSLEAGCGPHQPWVSIPAGLVGEARRQAGAHTVCLDTPLPKHIRHGSNEE